jgi:hypothetical protein
MWYLKEKIKGSYQVNYIEQESLEYEFRLAKQPKKQNVKRLMQKVKQLQIPF